MTTAELKNIFEKEYNRNEWTAALREIFLIQDLHIQPPIVDLGENTFGATAIELGFFETTEGLMVGLYEVSIRSDIRLERNKVGLRNLMRKVYSRDGDAALIVFSQGKSWRFSYVSELTFENKETGKRERRQTDSKRYTYLFGVNQLCRTAAERFASIQPIITLFGKKISIQEIEKAFSVETLTKDFYKELSDWYFWSVNKVIFPSNKDHSEDINNSTNLIRLITRLIFVWFMKQKGLIPDELFDKNELDNILNYSDSTGSTYYKAILQNLFFATLNTPLKGDNRSFVRRQTGKQDYYRYQRFFKNNDRFLELTRDIPYLNGGLFDNLDKRIANGEPEDVFIDCFTNHQNNESLLSVPDYLFFGGAKDVDLSEPYFDEKQKHRDVHGILDILKNYNFTVEENTPLDIQVALDPEMLGRVFENLLASYNPETKTTARKQTGSFYTPREIVNYMVDESLIVYLQRKLIHEEDNSIIEVNTESRLRELLSFSGNGNPFNEDETNTLVQAIHNIKVLDPACGSGAFPMGILQQLVHALQKLDPENILLKQLQIERTQEKLRLLFENGNPESFASHLKEIADNFEKNTQDYGRKLYLIENCIYGVDIQPIAVQIAKLRFFISLLCEQDVKPDEFNRGIKSLPNLDFKIVAANVIISAPQNDAIDAYARKSVNEFENLTTEYFYISSEEKPKLKIKIKNCINEICDANRRVINQWIDKIRRESSSANGAKLQKMKAQLQKFQQDLQHWDTYVNLFKNESVAFFETKYFFPHVKKGFDVIIGNPPYISFQRMKQEDKNPIINLKYKTFDLNGDIYTIFYERGQELLKSKGVLTYISSRQWMQAAYGKSFRNFLVNETNPFKLIDFGQVKIFEGATVFVNILFIENSPNKNDLWACLIPNEYNVEHGNLRDYFEAHKTKILTQENISWSVTTSQNLNDEILKAGIPLKYWTEIEFYAGIKSGLNEAYHIKVEKKDELIRLDPKSRDAIKPLLRGKDIKRYNYKFENWYTLFIPWHFPLHNDKSISSSSNIAELAFQKQYPAIYNHLLKFKDDLVCRNQAETGIRYEWYALQRYGADFWENYEKPKIVWIEISDRANYAFDDKGMYLTNSAYFLTTKSDSFSLKYLLAVLNSKVADFYFSQKTAKIAGGRMRYTKQFVEQVPIPRIPLEKQKPFISLVNYILYLKSQPLEKSSDKIIPFFFEQVVDAAVVELYFKDQVNQSGFEIITHLEDLPEANNHISFEVVRNIYERFNHPNHPIHKAVTQLKNYDPLKTIELSLNRKN